MAEREKESRNSAARKVEEPRWCERVKNTLKRRIFGTDLNRWRSGHAEKQTGSQHKGQKRLKSSFFSLVYFRVTVQE